MDARALATILLCAVALGACGGDSEDEPPRRATTTAAQPQPTVPGGTLQLPANVPLRAIGDADPGDIKVIRLWSEALRRGQITRAAALWAVPAKVQNGTPVLTLDTRADVRLFNDTFSCGTQLVSARGGGSGFTIAVFKLTRRPGADCGATLGNDARTAIFVRDGKIAEWYRLPDDPDVPAAPPRGPGAPTQTEPPAIPEI